MENGKWEINNGFKTDAARHVPTVFGMIHFQFKKKAFISFP